MQRLLMLLHFVYLFVYLFHCLHKKWIPIIDYYHSKLTTANF